MLIESYVHQELVSGGRSCSVPWRDACARSDRPARAVGGGRPAASSRPDPPVPEPGTSSETYNIKKNH